MNVNCGHQLPNQFQHRHVFSSISSQISDCIFRNASKLMTEKSTLLYGLFYSFKHPNSLPSATVWSEWSWNTLIGVTHSSMEEKAASRAHKWNWEWFQRFFEGKFTLLLPSHMPNRSIQPQDSRFSLPSLSIRSTYPSPQPRPPPPPPSLSSPSTSTPQSRKQTLSVSLESQVLTE